MRESGTSFPLLQLFSFFVASENFELTFFVAVRHFASFCNRILCKHYLVDFFGSAVAKLGHEEGDKYEIDVLCGLP